MRQLLGIAAATIMLAGCGPTAPTCSSETVLDTLKQIASRKLARDETYKTVFDIGRTRFDVLSIRSVSNEAKSCRCRANLKIVFSWTDQFKEQRDRDPSGFDAAMPIMNEFTLNGITLPVVYDATLTDDGKETYVQLYGIP